nr:hypothetical protein GCM10020093_008900 [Planobispora longispora]
MLAPELFTDSEAKLASQTPSAIRVSTFSANARTAGISSSPNSPASIASSGSSPREALVLWKK